MATGADAIRTILQLWNQSDQVSERKLKKILADGLDIHVQKNSDVLKKLSVGPELAVPVFRWMEEWAYPDKLTATWNGDESDGTITFSGYLFGTALTNGAATASLLNQVVRPGTILERPSDRVQLKIVSTSGQLTTSLAANPPTALVDGYGNTSGDADGGAITYDIISEVWSDYTDADNPRSLDRIFREVGTQIHAETFEIPKTRKNTKYEIVANEFQHQMDALMIKLRGQLAKAVLRSKPYHTGAAYVYGDQTQESTMCGILHWPVTTQAELANTNVYVNKSGVELNKGDMDDLVRNLWLDEHADFGAGDWWIVCDPITSAYMQDFDISYRRTTKDEKSVGFQVDEFNSKIGKTFPILAERIMPAGTLIVINFDKFSYGYYANDRMERKEIATAGRYQRWLMSFQTYGVVARNPRSNIGMIYGLPTS